MSFRQSCMACALLIVFTATCRADIFRWDNGQRIPGTEGITSGPGVHLENRNLEFADLSEVVALYWDAESAMDLTGARFGSSNLTSADLTLATLMDAVLTGAVVTGANFSGTTSRGFTKEQLYSTASYQAKNLQSVTFSADFDFFPLDNLTGWDFAGQNLTGAK